PLPRDGMTNRPSRRWKRISALFDEAVELPPERRSAFLDSGGGGDTELESEGIRLLESSDRASGFLDQPAASQAGAGLQEGAAGDVSAACGSGELSGGSNVP